MRADRAIFPLRAMCQVLGLYSSGYSDWLRRGPSARERRDAELRRGIRRIWGESEKIYGCPRIHAALCDEGERVGRSECQWTARMVGERARQPPRHRLHRTAADSRPDTRERPWPVVEVQDRDVRARGDTSLPEGG